MCGITGSLSFGGQRDMNQDVLAMREALVHRGPDNSGLWSDGFCTLGHRRLSIIDLSSAGQQPICNENRDIWIVFNGEIYNFQSLRQELESAGHAFRSHTDTETLVHAYEKWGTDCVQHLRGMFAFALWDQRRRRLFLARDRMGQKPLFYAVNDGLFLFASELQGLLVNPKVPRDVEYSTIDEYLSYGYIAAPRTVFRAIRKLSPAHWMTVDLDQGPRSLHIERYWSLDYLPKANISEDEAADRLRGLMAEAVSLRMISDVPLGAFLSGGLDSSIVVGLMAKLSSRPIQTFTIGFNESGWNELAHARRVAEKWKTDHHGFIVNPDAMSVLPTLIRHYGEPYADSSALPSFYVAKLTHSNVTVALNGDGGDESFAGYTRFWASGLAERIMQFPAAGALTKAILSLVPDSTKMSQMRKIHRFIAAARMPMEQRYPYWVGIVPEWTRQRIYHPDFASQLAGYNPDPVRQLLKEYRHLAPQERTMATDVASYLPNDLLVKMDIACMTNSLEARSPFLDQAVMEFAARLPLGMKLRGMQAKYLLKKAFADLLPPENVKRSKMGFGVPVGEWFRGPMKDALIDTVLSDTAIARGYFNRQAVSDIVDAHISHQTDYSAQLWTLFMLELWHREKFLPQGPQYIKIAAAKTPPFVSSRA